MEFCGFFGNWFANPIWHFSKQSSQKRKCIANKHTQAQIWQCQHAWLNVNYNSFSNSLRFVKCFHFHRSSFIVWLKNAPTIKWDNEQMNDVCVCVCCRERKKSACNNGKKGSVHVQRLVSNQCMTHKIVYWRQKNANSIMMRVAKNNCMIYTKVNRKWKKQRMCIYAPFVCDAFYQNPFQQMVMNG